MSTRFPSLIEAPHIDAPAKKQMHFATTDWKLLKSRFLDAVLAAMILFSIVGLAYRWLH